METPEIHFHHKISSEKKNAPKPSRLKGLLAVAFGLALILGAYWAGYVHGGNAATTAAAAAATIKKNGNPSRAITITTGNQPDSTVTMARLLAGSPHPDSDLLDHWAGSLSLEECLADVKQLQDLPAGQPRDDMLKALVNAWSRKDPKGLLANADGIAAPKMRENGVLKALAHLAEASPADALNWIKQNADSTSYANMGKRMAAFVATYANTDPQGALNTVLTLDDSTPNGNQVKTKAVESLADSMANQGHFSDAIALFNQMPAGPLRSAALAEVADSWGQVAPQDAANWVATLQDPALINDAGQNLTDAWAASDPAAAAKWAMGVDLQNAAAGNNGKNGDTLLSNVVDSWAKYDLTAAGQFLNQLPPSPTKDAAIVSFVSRAAQDNPADTMKWVATVADKNMQASAFMQTAKQWNKQDPAAFIQFMTTTTALTDEQKQAVAAAFGKINAAKN